MPTTQIFRSSISRGVALFVVPLIVACGDRGSLVETKAPTPATQPATRPTPVAPWVPTAPVSAVFAGPENLYRPLFGMHGGFLSSYYEFYADSTFALRFQSNTFGAFDYAGRFSRADTLVTFAFFGSNTAGPWEATAVLKGNALNVKYNSIMMMADFLDGVYLRQ